MSFKKPPSIARLAVLALCITSAFAQTPAPKEPDELVRLRQDYHQKRQSAIKPIAAAYRQQLEILVRNLTSRNQLDAAILVRKELLAVADAGTDEEPLKKALLESKWSWIALNGEGGVVMTFHEDGTVNHRGMGGTWKITGPRDVKIIYTDGNSILLHFDETLDSYKRLGSKDQLHGSRLP